MSAWQITRTDGRIELAGELRLPDGAAIWRALHRFAPASPSVIELDLERVHAIDSAVVALVVQYRAVLAARSVRCDIVGGTPQIRAIVHLYRGHQPPPPIEARIDPVSAVAKFGGALAEVGQHAHQAIDFIGDLIAAIGAILRQPRRANWRSLPLLIERAGADGLVIVILLNFLVGFVIGYQSTRLLETYGANIYIADIVGISMARELAPLMTAIIMGLRSGTAYAAELGTMRVSEEIDAVRTMGFSPAAYLVFPRVLALAIVAPALTLLADIAGVVGGLVVGVASLGLTSQAYLHELESTLVFSDVWTGLIKSVAFAVTVALVGCQQGLAARGAAAGVGRSTTATVVVSVFAIVIIDTLLTVAFRQAGW